MQRRLTISAFVIFSVLAATQSTAQAAERWACGFLVPSEYNLIESDARFIIGTPGKDFICAGDSKNTIRAKGGADVIVGGGGHDVIYGGYGADEIYAGPGADRVIAGGGADLVWGGDGNDVILGGQGWDELWGHAGNDHITGGTGNDELHGVDGDDKLIGNQGFDILKGWTGNDVLWGGLGNDSLEGDEGNDRLIGGSHDDVLEGEDGDDYLAGLSGNDRLDSGAGQNTALGGDGNDALWLVDSEQPNVAAGGPGIDACYFRFTVDDFATQELGCENWHDSWFGDSQDTGYDTLVVEHHVAGLGEVPAEMVHVRGIQLGQPGSLLYDVEEIDLFVRKPPFTSAFRHFTESIGTGRDRNGSFIGKSFRKQLAAATVSGGRMVEVALTDGTPLHQLEVHLTSAAVDPDAGTIVVTGTPGVEVSFMVRDEEGNTLKHPEGGFVDLVHVPIPAAGVLHQRIADLPSGFTTVDVMRFDRDGDYEIFRDLVRSVTLEHVVGTQTARLTNPPLGSVEAVAIEVFDGATMVESATASSATNWVATFAESPQFGNEIRTTLPGGQVRSLIVAEAGLTQVTGTLAGDPWAAGFGPPGSEVHIEIWDLTLGRYDEIISQYNFRVVRTPDADGLWKTDGYENLGGSFVDPGIGAELKVVDDDGDAVLTLIEWPDHI